LLPADVAVRPVIVRRRTDFGGTLTGLLIPSRDGHLSPPFRLQERSTSLRYLRRDTSYPAIDRVDGQIDSFRLSVARPAGLGRRRGGSRRPDSDPPRGGRVHGAVDLLAREYSVLKAFARLEETPGVPEDHVMAVIEDSPASSAVEGRPRPARAGPRGRVAAAVRQERGLRRAEQARWRHWHAGTACGRTRNQMYCMRSCMYCRVVPRRYSMDARQEETAERRRRLLDAKRLADEWRFPGGVQVDRTRGDGHEPP
jgi:hypothetical protein